jgi:hypothetical protein
VEWVQGEDIGLDATIYDTYNIDIPIYSQQPFEYSQSHTCSSDFAAYGPDGTYSGSADNTAIITWTGGSDNSSAHTEYTCESGQVTLLKLTNGLVEPDRDWTFELYTGGYGGTLVASDTTFGDADGILDFGGLALTLGTTYTLCEIGIPDGWTSTWSDPGAYFAAAGVKCVDFTPTSVERTFYFEVDNERRSQLAPTGYACEAFYDETAPDLILTVNPSGQIAPGRFFYYNLINSAGEFVITVESNPLAADDPIADGAKVWIVDEFGNCQKIDQNAGVSIVFGDNNDVTITVPEAYFPNEVVFRVEYKTPEGVEGIVFNFKTNGEIFESIEVLTQ